MRHVSTLVIGAGQAGLAMSRCLSDRAIDHVVIERGEVANSWRRERWDSLRLLTPNWQSRLPGYAYRGTDPDGFMTMPEVIQFLLDYADLNGAPVEERTCVTSVTAESDDYRVSTTRGDWLCRSVVVASGACNQASIPAFAAAIPTGVAQLNAAQYRNPAQLADGGVLVVGASATGVQLASEIRAAGHAVTLAAGEHIRMPRHYRARDIQWWMERAGIHGTRTTEVEDLERARRVPSLQLVGSAAERFVDLNALQDAGIEIVGRLAAIRDGKALFSGSLANHCALSDLKMNRLLETLDSWAKDNLGEDLPAMERFPATQAPRSPRLSHDLTTGRFRTVIWATGFRPDHTWLHLPVFDAKGQLIHREGQVAPGLHVLGLPFLRRRNSALIDGVGADAAFVAERIFERRSRLAA